MRNTPTRHHVLRLALACSSLFAAGAPLSCAGASRSAVVHVAPAGSESWESVVAEHTRRHEPYDWVMRQADLRATLVTPRLRKAFITHRSEFYGRFSKETERDLAGMGSADEGVDAAMKAGPDGEEQLVVFVAMFVADQKNRDLAASYTIWDSALVRDGVRVSPSSIETIRPSPAVNALFPYVDRFDDLYIMRFPLAPPGGAPLLTIGGAPLVLEVNSALARASVEWVLAE